MPIASEEEEKDRERGALGGRDGTLPSGKAAKCWSGDGRSLSQKVGGGRVCSVENNTDFQKACRGHWWHLGASYKNVHNNIVGTCNLLQYL